MAKSGQGKVKFYSADKGFGFIFDEESASDLFFHITAVQGAEPPKVGDTVSYQVAKDPKKGRLNAQGVQVFESSSAAPAKRKPAKPLEGFPCIRGDSIKGFTVKERLGEIAAGKPVLRIFPAYSSANKAQNALIEKAKALGANAILNYTWHNDRRKEKRAFSRETYLVDNFWAEGRAVILEPDS